jgi:hypothetical protein
MMDEILGAAWSTVDGFVRGSWWCWSILALSFLIAFVKMVYEAVNRILSGPPEWQKRWTRERKEEWLKGRESQLEWERMDPTKRFYDHAEDLQYPPGWEENQRKYYQWPPPWENERHYANKSS